MQNKLKGSLSQCIGYATGLSAWFFSHSVPVDRYQNKIPNTRKNLFPMQDKDSVKARDAFKGKAVQGYRHATKAIDIKYSWRSAAKPPWRSGTTIVE